MAATSARDGWGTLFTAAFRDSSNAMALANERRCHVDINGAYVRLLGYTPDQLIGRPIWRLVVDGPLLSPEEWAAALAAGRFAGQTNLVCANGSTISVQWGAHAVLATERKLVLFVALSTSRWGARFRRDVSAEDQSGPPLAA
jgi:PAS domain S-box-containing protein